MAGGGGGLPGKGRAGKRGLQATALESGYSRGKSPGRGHSVRYPLHRGRLSGMEKGWGGWGHPQVSFAPSPQTRPCWSGGNCSAAPSPSLQAAGESCLTQFSFHCLRGREGGRREGCSACAPGVGPGRGDPSPDPTWPLGTPPWFCKPSLQPACSHHLPSWVGRVKGERKSANTSILPPTFP